MKEFRIFFTALFLSFLIISLFYRSLLLSVIIVGSLIFTGVSFIIGLVQYFCMKVSLPTRDIIVSREKNARYMIKIKNFSPLSIAPIKIYGRFANECESPYESAADPPASAQVSANPKSRKRKPATREIFITSVAPNRDIKPSWERNCMRRGEYKIGVTRIEMFDMLKLFCFTKKFSNPLTLVVLPRERLFPLNISGEYTEAQIVSNIQDGDEFSHVREYVNGDNTKAIHWKATAKSDRIMVKQNEKNGGGDSAVYASFEGADALWCEYVIEVALAAVKTILSASGETAVYFCDEVHHVKSLLDYDRLRRRFAELTEVPLDSDAFMLKLTESSYGAKYLITLSVTEAKATHARVILLSETQAAQGAYIQLNPAL
ncbi:hypothetical protein FACS1894133_3840 [Clostridia bacterium]|nr:hypothetical protein FACS1894133_3840 [Clostridia bacterium]